MGKKTLQFIIGSFLIWRITLFLFVLIAPLMFPLQKHFLGGGLENYLRASWFWGFFNFDGEHYLAIATRGYRDLEYFFFPIYPLLINIISQLFSRSLLASAAVAFLLSNALFLAALFGFWKLLRPDFSQPVLTYSILLLIFFPTSFFFGSTYTESLFFALIVWSFYFARMRRWFLASILGVLASATRIVGIILLPALLVEYFKLNAKVQRSVVWLLLIPMGLISYMFYLWRTTGDSLEFLHTITLFGAQRSSTIILLPQVFYRYLFKILPNLDYSYFPVVFSTFLELSVASVFSVLSVISFFYLRRSYAVYLALGFLIPTMSGSFSSLPRYVLVLFPAFILMATYFSKFTRASKILIFGLLFGFLLISTSMFLRGLWIA